MTNKSSWYYSIPAVIILLFFVLGPLALPLLYKSPNFSNGQKITLTIIVLLFTISIYFFLSNLMNQLLAQMDQIDEMLKQVK